MKKLFFYATYPNHPIGYSKIGCLLCNFLVNSGYDVYYFGISNFKELAVERFIDPKIKLIDALNEDKKLGSPDLYGVDILQKYLENIKPDIFFIYNDLILVNRVFLAIKEAPIFQTFKKYVYIDLVYPFERLDLIQRMDTYTDRFFVFTEYWKQNLIEMDVLPEKIRVLPHGFSYHYLHKINKDIARKKFNISEGDFVILNTNRNCYRKAQDITISAFLQFLKKNNLNENIKMFINCKLDTKEGYDILLLIKTECKKLNISYEDVIYKYILCPIRANELQDEDMNIIYNSCDVGINTCIGEGFGLCNMEQAGLDIPQIVTYTGGLRDIFGTIEEAKTIKPVVSIHIPKLLDDHGGYVDICKVEDFVDALQYYYEDSERREKEGANIGKIIREKYDWNIILSEFLNDLN
jgi:glycosyltransferase involved in cell wall biosynthesis